MTQRLSEEINQGLRIKQALHEKIENITIVLTTKLEDLLRYNSFSFKDLKGYCNHFVDGGWSGTSKAIFIFTDGWNLELTSGNHVSLQNSKLDFLVKSGEYGGTRYNPPVITACPDSLDGLYKIDTTLDHLLLSINNTFTPLQKWFDDLKVRK